MSARETRRPLLDSPGTTSVNRNGRTPAGGAGGRYDDRNGGREEPTSYQAVDHRYLSSIDTLQKELRRLETVTSSLKRAFEDIGTARETKATRADLRRLVEEGRNLIKSTTTTLREVSDMKMPTERSERTGRQLEIQKFGKDLKERLTNFQKVANAVEVREKETARSERHASSIAEEEEEEDEEQGRIRFQNMRQVEFKESMVEERAEAIQEIHTAVVEVNEMFRDLAVLVEDQQKDIDNIELNITDGHTKTADGVKQLEQAQKHQAKSRGKIFCLLAVVLCIAGGVAALIAIKAK